MFFTANSERDFPSTMHAIPDGQMEGGAFFRVFKPGTSVSIALSAADVARLIEDLASLPKPAPVAPVSAGDRIRILTDGTAEGLRHYLKISSIAEVVSVKPNRYGSGWMISVRGTASDGRTISQTLREGTFEAYAEESPVGSVLYVTGDSAEQGHDFAIGTEVSVAPDGEDDYLADGTYLVSGVDSSGDVEDWWVSSLDLDVEAPEIAPTFEVGDKVRVTSDPETSGVEGIRLYGLAKVGDVLTVKGESTSWRTTYPGLLKTEEGVYVMPAQVEKVEAPSFEVGEKVKVVGNTPGNPAGPHHFFIGAEVEVVAVPSYLGEDTLRLEGYADRFENVVEQTLLVQDVAKIERAEAGCYLGVPGCNCRAADL